MHRPWPIIRTGHGEQAGYAHDLGPARLRESLVSDVWIRSSAKLGPPLRPPCGNSAGRRSRTSCTFSPKFSGEFFGVLGLYLGIGGIRRGYGVIAAVVIPRIRREGTKEGVFRPRNDDLGWVRVWAGGPTCGRNLCLKTHYLCKSFILCHFS